MRRWFCVAGIVLSTTGCVRPVYETQNVIVPNHWHWKADDSSTECNQDWWVEFGDPILTQLILISLANNQEIQIAVSRVFEYYARLGIATSGLFPTVTGNATFSRYKSSIALPGAGSSFNSGSNTGAGAGGAGAGGAGGMGTGALGAAAPSISRINNQFLAYLNLNWEIDFWGKLVSARDAAYADLLASIQGRRAVTLTVVKNVANAYFILRQYDAQLAISLKTLQSRLESLELAKDRFELGETSELEVAQSESEVEDAKIRVLEFQRSIAQQENLLSVLLGQSPHEIIRGRSLDKFDYPISVPAGLPSELLVRRPDIVEAEQRLIAANARVAQARALYFPTISLTGQYGSESAALSKFLTSPAEFWSYGINAIQTIFDAGNIYYHVQEAIAIRDELLFGYRNLILKAFGEVEDALVAVQKNRELAEEHAKQVKVLTNYLHLAQLRYEEGEVDYLNVLDAERQLFEAQLQWAQAQSDSFTAIVELYGALGGGWVIEADGMVMESLPHRWNIRNMCDREEGKRVEKGEESEW